MPKRSRDYRIGLLEELRDARAAARYLNAALDDSQEMFLVALRDVAEARQMSQVAEDAGVAREALYRMLSITGNPRYNSLRGIFRALGLRLEITSPRNDQSFSSGSDYASASNNSTPGNPLFDSATDSTQNYSFGGSDTARFPTLFVRAPGTELRPIAPQGKQHNGRRTEQR